jgi:hypothetical protein
MNMARQLSCQFSLRSEAQSTRGTIFDFPRSFPRENNNSLRSGSGCSCRSVPFHLFGRNTMPPGFICRREKDLLKFYTQVVNLKEITHVIYAHTPMLNRPGRGPAAREAWILRIGLWQAERGVVNPEAVRAAVGSRLGAVWRFPPARKTLSNAGRDRDRRQAERTQYCASRESGEGAARWQPSVCGKSAKTGRGSRFYHICYLRINHLRTQAGRPPDFGPA